jgi:hypothetical protein
MKNSKTLLTLGILIVPLALLAAGAGVFWQGSGAAFPFTSLRGETVLIQGHGLYFYDSVNSAS